MDFFDFYVDRKKIADNTYTKCSETEQQHEEVDEIA